MNAPVKKYGPDRDETGEALFRFNNCAIGSLAAARPHAFDLFLDALIAQDPSASSSVPLVAAREAAYRSGVMAAMYKAADEGAWVSLT